MGRKRTSNKKGLKLSIDKDIVAKLEELNINKSALFTEIAMRIIEEYEKKEDKKEMIELKSFHISCEKIKKREV